MQILSRVCMSADGNVTTPDGWPPQVVDPAHVPGLSHGIPEFLQSCEAALMGRTTFEPALTNDRWPWPNLDVFVLGSSPARRYPRARNRRQRPGAAAGEDAGGKWRWRRPPDRWPHHHRDVPSPWCPRQARIGRAADLGGGWDETHASVGSEHPIDLRELTGHQRWLGGDRLRRGPAGLSFCGAQPGRRWVSGLSG